MSKVLYVINKYKDFKVVDKNFYISLVRSLGGNIGYIESQGEEGEENEVVCNKFSDFML